MKFTVDDPIACLQSPIAPLSLFFTNLRTQNENDLVRIDLQEKPIALAKINQTQGGRSHNEVRSTSAFGLLYVDPTKQEVRMQ